MRDVFGESGEPDEIIEKYGMGVKISKKQLKKSLRGKMNKVIIGNQNGEFKQFEKN